MHGREYAQAMGLYGPLGSIIFRTIPPLGIRKGFPLNYSLKNKMTKADIVKEIADKTGIEPNIVLITVEAFMETVKESMANEQNIYLRGFGSFIIKQRAEKTARNISRNTTLIIPAHNIPAFKPSKSFMARVAGAENEEEA